MSPVLSPLHPIRFRAYRYLLLTRFCTSLAQTGVMVVVAWQAYTLARQEMGIHAATAQLGFIGLAQFLPLFFLTPVSGWVADHSDRRKIGMASTLLLVLCSTILAISTKQGWVSLPLLFFISALLGVARCFSGPAISSMVARILPTEVLPRAIAFGSLFFQAASIIGPALGGYVFAILPWGTYAGAAVLLVISVAGLGMLPPIPPSATDRTRHPLRQMVDGLVYVRSNKLVLGAITLDLMAVLLAGATALLPVYARDILHVGATGLGRLAAATGVGAAVSAAWLSFRPIENEVGNKMLISVGLFGLATAIFGMTAFMPSSIAEAVALGSLFCCGVADMVSVYIRQSLIQIYTPDAMRGRVSSVSMLTISASNQLGEAESGFIAALIGPITTVIAGGIGAVLVTLLWGRLFPQLGLARRFDMANMNAMAHDSLKQTEDRP